MLMEYRDEEIEKMLENLPEVPVPAELSRRITERIDKTVRRRSRTKVLRRSMGAVAAGWGTSWKVIWRHFRSWTKCISRTAVPVRRRTRSIRRRR